MFGKRVQRWAVLVGIAVAVTACGSDGPRALSEDDFLDELASICSEAARDLGRIDEPQDLRDIEDGAEDAVDILTEAKAALAALRPPSDRRADFEQFRDVIDDEIAAMEDIGEAAADEDEAGVQDAVDDLTDLYADQTEIAEDLDADECVPDDVDAPAVPTPGTVDSIVANTGVTVTDDTDPAGTTASTGGATPSLPTLPPITTAPATAPAPTAAPATQGEITIDSITSVLAAPAGYTMTDTATDRAEGFVIGLSADATLGSVIDVIGIGDLTEGSGITVARVFVALTAAGVDMPPAWDDYFCEGTGTAVTTPAGFPGTQCSFTADDGSQEFYFTVRGGNTGYATVAVDPNLDLLALADAFFAANPEL